MVESNSIALFDEKKRIAPNGTEYWMARDLAVVLTYADWDNFQQVLSKARIACESSGVNPDHHFRGTTRMIAVGHGAQRKVRDVFLSRYASYLVAMNGDASKQPIADAQTYFAVQTRRQEVADERNQADVRIELRDRIKENVKALNSAAKQAGVQNYALFHDAGYRGLYGGLGLSQVKERKGLSINENLMDRASPAELAANDFRITQAEEKLRREKIKGDIDSRNLHREVGQEVRATIKKLRGDMPEDLAPQASIKKLSSGRKKNPKSLPPPSQS